MNGVANVLLLLIGLSGGLLVAGGLFAFLTLIGVITRLAAGTKTAKFLMFYEDMSLLGATVGNIAYLYHVGIPIGNLGFLLYGLGAGIFTGCLAAALAEVVKMMPVLSERMNLKRGMTIIMIIFAFGKMVGALIGLLG